MDQHAISESTPMGTTVYTLEATSTAADNVTLSYFVGDTDVFSVDPVTGDVVLQRALDREVWNSVSLYEYRCLVGLDLVVHLYC